MGIRGLLPGHVILLRSPNSSAKVAPRGGGPSRRESTTPSPTVEEYIESIYKLSLEGAPVRAVRLAQDMGVAAASVTEMVRRLVKQGFVSRGQDLEISLTQEGESTAIRLLRRHRLAERFLTDMIGLSWDKVHQEACRFEHVLSPEVEEGLDRLLNFPATCPHGYPIPSADGQVAQMATRWLSECSPGDGVVVARVPEGDPDLLRYLSSLGIKPGVQIAVESVAPFDGPIHIRAGGAEFAIGLSLAAQIAIGS